MHRTSRARVVGALTVVAVLATTPAGAAPSTPTFGPVIEGLASYDPQSTCSPTVKPGTGALRSLVLATYKNTGDSGIVRSCDVGGTSEHKEGRAWDWRVNAYDAAQHAAARDLLTWLLATDAHGNQYALARRLGIMYVIWDRHIWSAYNASAGWRPYSGSNPHTGHVHISLSRRGGDKLTTFWSPDKTVPPPVDPTDLITAKWNELGGSGGVLGARSGDEYAVAGGRAQDYAGGTVYWSSATGAKAVYGSIGLRYRQFGGPTSVLGFPTTDEQDVTGGRASTFQNGRALWSLQTDVKIVYGQIAQKYAKLGGPDSELGLPVTDEIPVAGVDGARRSVFQGGEVLWSPATGANAVWGSIRLRYLEQGGPQGYLGLPTSDETAVRGGRRTLFQGGGVYWSLATGTQVVRGGIAAEYHALGGPDSPLGLPTRDEHDVTGGRRSTFQNGHVLWSRATGPRSVAGPTAAKYDALGGPDSFLGLPTTHAQSVPGGLDTRFQGGRILWSDRTGAQSVQGGIAARYEQLGGPGGPLGLPITDELDVPGGRASSFVGGRILWSRATGAQPVLGEVADKYEELGGPRGQLGLPTASDLPVRGGRATEFTGGTIYASPATGAHATWGGVRAKYLALGGPSGPLGLPVTDEHDVTGGRRSTFQGGAVLWSRATGAHSVQGSIGARYAELGGSGGDLGMPTTDERPYGRTGRATDFQGGRLTWALATGVRRLDPDVAAHLDRYGGPDGPLGLPVADATPLEVPAATTDGDTTAQAAEPVEQQRFTGGTVYSRAGVVGHVRGSIAAHWASLGGLTGRLGMPVSGEYDVAGGKRTDFEHGTLTWWSSTGRVTEG